jgi:hypothetical protein
VTPGYAKVIVVAWGLLVLTVTVRQARNGELKGKGGSIYKERQPALFWFMTTLVVVGIVSLTIFLLTR